MKVRRHIAIAAKLARLEKRRARDRARVKRRLERRARRHHPRAPLEVVVADALLLADRAATARPPR